MVSGKLCGTSHLKAKVVRDLAKISNTDCIAGQQLFKKLMDPTVAVPSKVDKYDTPPPAEVLLMFILMSPMS